MNWLRLPGVFHRSDIDATDLDGVELLIQEAGHDTYGARLVVLYVRDEPHSEAGDEDNAS